MKKQLQFVLLVTSLCVCILVPGISGKAQSGSSISKWYVQGAAGGGNYGSFDGGVGLTAVVRNQWSLSLTYNDLDMRPKNQPADYKPETGYVFFVPYTYEIRAHMNLVNVTIGRYWSTGKNTWATVGGGLSFVHGERVHYERTESVTTNVLIAETTTSNYNTTKEVKSTVGALIQGDINWAFASFLGLGVGTYVNLNAIQSPVSVQVKLLAGKMNRVKRHRRVQG